MCVALLLTLHCIGSLVFPVIGCTLAHAGKVIQTSTLEASPSSSWAGILVDMCLIPALSARRPGLCLQGVSGTTRSFISHAKPSWCGNLFQLWITCVLTVDFLPVFHHFTAFTCYLKSLNCFSYRFQVSIISNDFIPKLDVAGFDHSHHDDCVVQCDGEIAMKRLLSAFRLEVSEVHVW